MDTIKINRKNTKIIAHRGLSGIERENTNPAFVAAGNRSYFGIETDVHVTADGRFVIIHDETTDRVSMGNVNVDVEKSNYSDLTDIVLPDLDGSLNRQDIRIPLLEDYIKICQKYEKICVLELKNDFVDDDIRRMVAHIDELGYLDKVIFISFSLDNCIKLRKILHTNDIQWLISREVTSEVIDTLKAHKLNLDIHYSHLSKEVIDKLHSIGILVNCWTCDIKEDAEKLVDMGVDFITSNIVE